MAGGGESLGGGPKQKRGSSTRKSKKRVGFKVDMTPLVDITFLLLTFFMFTTTMASPQIMDMSVPPESDKPIEVKERDLFTLFLTDNNDIYWRQAKEEPQPIELSKIQNLAVRTHMDATDPNAIITALKVSHDATYDMVINILDELNIAEARITREVSKMTGEDGQPKNRERRFTIADITEDEQVELDLVTEGE